LDVLVFSHEQDVDGIFSAAILKIAFQNCETVLTNYGIEKMNAVADKIASFVDEKPAGTVIIADVGVNEESYGPVLEALRVAHEKGWKNVWVDHHVWPEKPLQEISSVCEMVLFAEVEGEVKKCAAELCAGRFAPESELAKKLAAIAHRTDFPDSSRFPIPPLTALISYYLGFPELVGRLHSVILESVVQGVLWNMEMQDDIIEASRLIDESLARSIEGMTVKEFAPDIKVAIAKSDAFVSRSMLLGRIMDDYDIDIAIAFTGDGKVSIRRKDNGRQEIFSCSKIAQEFREGGGHEGAAGGFLNSRPEEAGDAAAITEIATALKSYFAKKST
jgi:oligoribonuclease NrnB/cAMP/cGMP phosphodiesterase (DHH superfamily)